MPDYPPLNETVRFTSSETSISKLLDFECYSAQVYSNANQWLHFVGTGQYIGPGAQGTIVTLPGFQTAELEWAAPPGTPQPPASPSTEANVVYYSIWLPPSPGTGGNVQQTPKPYDGQAIHRPLAGVQATITLTGTPGRRWIAHTIVGSHAQLNATNAGTVQFTLVDGPSGGAPVLFAEDLGVDLVAGHTDHCNIVGAAYAGSPGNAMTLEFNGSIPGTIQRLSLGAYLV